MAEEFLEMVLCLGLPVLELELLPRLAAVETPLIVLSLGPGSTFLTTRWKSMHTN